MRIIFIGSTSLSCCSLKALLNMDSVDVVAVVSQPDKPRGRSLKTHSSLVKELCCDLKVEVYTPEDINSETSVSYLKSLNPDIIVVAAYGQILREAILSLAPQGCINVHTSLLPKYRGAAPIQWAIINGDKLTGVTIMKVDKRMDAGDIISHREVVIEDHDTAGTLHDKLAEVGSELLVETLSIMKSGSKIETIAQVDSDATYAPKLSKQDAKIAWNNTSKCIYNKVRGLNPCPMCWCTVNGRRLRVMKVEECESVQVPAGEVVELSPDGPIIAAEQGAVKLIEVQPEGKKVMSGSAYLRGYHISVGDVFE